MEPIIHIPGPPPTGLSDSLIYNPIFNYDQQEEYTIRITSDSGCIIVDTLLVQLNTINLTNPSSLVVPKAWTPDGNGINDKLFPLTKNIKQLIYFRIFNRWGQLVFETNIIGNGWDGVYKGVRQVMDVYTWTAKAIDNDGHVILKNGNSVLLR